MKKILFILLILSTGILYGQSYSAKKVSTDTIKSLNQINKKIYIKDTITIAGNVGIGTTSPTEMLEVNGNAKGDTAKFIFYEGISDNVWTLTGNAGTTVGTNFIGTSDNVSLMFKINNQQAGLLDSSLMNTFLGYQTGTQASGIYNTGMGFQSLYGLNTGIYNTALGMKSGANINSGQGNTAIGGEALSDNGVGHRNTAIGGFSLDKTISSYNTAVGYESAYFNYSGTGNTVLGAYALHSNTTGSNNVALGSAAGYSSTSLSNRIFIGTKNYGSLLNDSTKSPIFINDSSDIAEIYLNGNVYSTYNIGIGTTSPTEMLEVNGNVKGDTGIFNYAGTITADNFLMGANNKSTIELYQDTGYIDMGGMVVVGGLYGNFSLNSGGNRSTSIYSNEEHKLIEFTDSTGTGHVLKIGYDADSVKFVSGNVFISENLTVDTVNGKISYNNVVGLSDTINAVDSRLDTLETIWQRDPLPTKEIYTNSAYSNWKVGINEADPAYALHVEGDVYASQNLISDDTTITEFIQITDGASSGKYLQSDASGVGSWASISTCDSTLQIGDVTIVTGSFSLADDGTYNLPSSVHIAELIIWADTANAMGNFRVYTDGVVTLYYGTNVANTDSDSSLCVYDSGTYAIIKNRLGYTELINFKYTLR